MSPLRKLLAIALLVAFGLPFASSLFALTPKSKVNLPACCRRNGKHHCVMSIPERQNATNDGTQFSAPPDKCPYCPSSIAAGHTNPLASGAHTASARVCVSSHPTGLVQTESKRRISRDRSRQKRGPPIPIFL